jgi:hypothetical protein
VKKLAFIFVIITSCSPATRLSRLLANNPYLIQNVDTTIYFETSSVDTQFVFNNSTNVDTFFIESTKTKIYRFYDTLRVEQIPVIDSVSVIKKTVNIQEKEKDNNFYNKAIVVLSFIVIIMALYLFRNIIK